MAQAHAHPNQSHSHDEHHAHPNYVKIWAILLALLVVSVLGPMLEIKVVTLATAFGIAFVKAYLVAKNFMHVNIEKRYIAYMLTTCLIFMLLFFAGAAPDVMKHEGDQWVKPNYHQDIPDDSHHGAGAAHGAGGHSEGGEAGH
jgi:caa(3)-type oxidase subunit IV